jgi:hypothetical protein
MSEYPSGLAPELTGGGEKSFGENFEKKRWKPRRGSRALSNSFLESGEIFTWYTLCATIMSMK